MSDKAMDEVMEEYGGNSIDKTYPSTPDPESPGVLFLDDAEALARKACRSYALKVVAEVCKTIASDPKMDVNKYSYGLCLSLELIRNKISSLTDKEPAPDTTKPEPDRWEGEGRIDGGCIGTNVHVEGLPTEFKDRERVKVTIEKIKEDS